jgi:8-oxo-dGTP pyrophosphatase MutT (NUDIX family)
VAARGGPQRIPRPPEARPGGSPPWDGCPRDWQRGIDLRRIRLAFRGGPAEEAGRSSPSALTGAVVEAPGSLSPQRAAVGGDGRAPAAVLVVVFEESGEAEVVLTRRSSLLRTHTGEVSFPGGRLEASETPAAAALREANEEVGLDPAGVEVLGALSAISTISSRAGLYPVVGLVGGRPALVPNPAEVERAFTVSLAELMAPSVYHQEEWGHGDSARVVHFFELVGETVWGATAKVLVDLLGRVVSVPPESSERASRRADR